MMKQEMKLSSGSCTFQLVFLVVFVQSFQFPSRFVIWCRHCFILTSWQTPMESQFVKLHNTCGTKKWLRWIRCLGDGSQVHICASRSPFASCRWHWRLHWLFRALLHLISKILACQPVPSNLWCKQWSLDDDNSSWQPTEFIHHIRYNRSILLFIACSHPFQSPPLVKNTNATVQVFKEAPFYYVKFESSGSQFWICDHRSVLNLGIWRNSHIICTCIWNSQGRNAQHGNLTVFHEGGMHQGFVLRNQLSNL